MKTTMSTSATAVVITEANARPSNVGSCGAHQRAHIQPRPPEAVPGARLMEMVSPTKSRNAASRGGPSVRGAAGILASPFFAPRSHRFRPSVS